MHAVAAAVASPAFGTVCLVRLPFDGDHDVHLQRTTGLGAAIEAHHDGVDATLTILGAVAVPLDAAGFDHAERVTAAAGRGRAFRAFPVTAHGRTARLLQARAEQGLRTVARARPTRFGWEVLSIVADPR